MTRKIKEKLINNLNREINIMNNISHVLIILIGVCLVSMLFGIIPNVVLPSILYKMFDILLVIEWCILICIDSSKAIQHAINYEQVDIYKNNLLNVILSDSKALNTFFCACSWTSIILNWNILLSLIFVILWWIAPSKLAKKFKNELIKEKEV